MAEKTNLAAMSTCENFEWEDGVIVEAFDKSVAKKFENMRKLEKQWQSERKEQEKLQEEETRKEMELLRDQERSSEEIKLMEEELAEIPMADDPEKKHEWQSVPPKTKENKKQSKKRVFIELNEDEASTSSPKKTYKKDEARKSLSPKPDENKKDETKKSLSSKPDENKKDKTKKHVSFKWDENKKGKHFSHDSRQWKVGAHCRAIYSVDGNEYEADIIKVDYKKGTCVVRFCGYEYDEEVNIDTLLPTAGRPTWQNQRHEEYRNTRSNRRECKCTHSQFNTLSRGLPPPPPPFVLSNLPTDEGDALSAMLMSWYMSGFHTGYYQGLMKARNNHHLH